MKLLKSKTLSITVNAKPKEVYAFASNPHNLPKWAKAFCLSIKKAGNKWVVTSPQGPVVIKFARKNAFGILDHVVSPAPGVAISVPMRVVANGSGSEVIFTLYRMPGVSDVEVAKDVRWVEEDLGSLKRILER